MTAHTDTLAALMGALETLEATVHPDLVVQQWRPRAMPELPGLWNWLPTRVPARQRDNANLSEVFTISAFVGVEHSDADEEMAAVMAYADAFRAVIDPALRSNPTLGGAASRGWRTDLGLVVDTFSETDVLCVEFPLSFEINRIINP